MNVDLIMPAAGMGVRFSKNTKKQFYYIAGKPVIHYTLLAMFRSYPFERVIIGVNPDDIDFVKRIYGDIGFDIPLIIAGGGATRAETVYNCLKESQSQIVVIHDAVRPFVLKEQVEEVISKADIAGAAICALPIRDTVKRVIGGAIDKTIPRDNLYLAHTPQAFNRSLVYSYLWEAITEGRTVTDEASALEHDLKVEIALSTPENIKITYESDKWLAEALIGKYFGY